MIIQNIENKIKLATFVAIGSLAASVIISSIVSFIAYRQVNSALSSIYVLIGDVPVVAKQTNMEQNRPAEYKATVDLFHYYFFSLTPDDKHIEYQMKKAMYLIDESGVQQYNNLKEKGYFNSILSSSSVLTLTTDSIPIDERNKRFTFYGKLKIERASSTLIRSLITEGDLFDINRSENNGHGVMLKNWRIVENKDLTNVPKATF